MTTLKKQQAIEALTDRELEMAIMQAEGIIHRGGKVAYVKEFPFDIWNLKKERARRIQAFRNENREGSRNMRRP